MDNESDFISVTASSDSDFCGKWKEKEMYITA